MHTLLVQFFHSREQLLHRRGSRTQESGFLGADYLCGFLIHDQYPGRNLMRSFRTAPGSWVILCCNTRLQFTQKSSNRIILGRKIAMIQENFMIELFYKATKSPSFFLPPWYPQTFLIKLLTKQPSHQAPSLSSSSFTSYQLAEFISPWSSCISTPMRNLQANCTTNVAHPQNHSRLKPAHTHSTYHQRPHSLTLQFTEGHYLFGGKRHNLWQWTPPFIVLWLPYHLHGQKINLWTMRFCFHI